MLLPFSVRMVYMDVLVQHRADRGDTGARCLTKVRTLDGRGTDGSIA